MFVSVVVVEGQPRVVLENPLRFWRWNDKRNENKIKSTLLDSPSVGSVKACRESLYLEAHREASRMT